MSGGGRKTRKRGATRSLTKEGATSTAARKRSNSQKKRRDTEHTIQGSCDRFVSKTL